MMLTSSRRLRAGLLAVLLAALHPWHTGAAQQQVAQLDRGPRFVRVGRGSSVPVEVDVSRTPVLRQRVSLNRDGQTLAQLLSEITRQTGVRFAYNADVVETDRIVALKAESITVAAALTEILADAGVDVVLRAGNQATLMPRRAAASQDSAAVVGRVTDRKTGAALAGATVVVQGTSHSATTGSDGRYRIADVAPGTYTLRARYIGYSPGQASVTVSAEHEATADFTLERSAQPLDEVVTTGTVVPTEVRALPTPTTVISDSEIALQRPHNVQELLRQAVPTAVGWDVFGAPYQAFISMRGASALDAGYNQVKVFVDGIESDQATQFAVDPSSIDRVEVIRGPQAGAIYGSDAIGGVIQIFTKRGDASVTHPHVNAEAALGVVQTPYAGFERQLQQAYRASVEGGGPDVSYHLGAGYSRTAQYLPDGGQSNPSIYGGLHFARGMVTVDVSGRRNVWNGPEPIGPQVYTTGFAFFAQPLYWDLQVRNETYGARMSLLPLAWWTNNVTVGVDRYGVDVISTRPRLTTAADTLLNVYNKEESKLSIGYNSSLHGALSPSLSGSITVGFDHYSNPVNSFSTSGALNTTGPIQTASTQSVSATRTITNNTGYFGQVQLDFRQALYLTGGLRAEQNTNFGDSLGTPLSPRVGLSFVQLLGGATLKLRSSWGRGIRPPVSAQKDGNIGAGSATLANERLGPERQQGWDGGIDVLFGWRGSLSATYYNQTAENLIQQVQVAVVPIPTFQYQNVARVKNSGVEIEGALNVGALRLKGQYGYARARVDQLAPGYTGPLQVGDQALVVPRHTAGASFALSPLPATTIAGGLTYVGSWNQSDYLALYACFGGTGPCHATERDYVTAFPGFVKLNLTVSQQLGSALSAFISLDNLTNNAASESDNVSNVVGRVSTVGLRLRY